MNSLKILLSFTLVVFITEHCGRINNINYKPSDMLQFIADKSVDLFWNIGKFFAWISSFLTIIDMNELIKTFWDIGSPICQFITSPLYMINGYLEQAMTYYVNKTSLIFMGSIMLIASIAYLCYRYSLISKLRLRLLKFRGSANN